MATPFTRSSFNTPALNSFASARNRRELLMRKGLRDLRRSGREAARYGSPGAVAAVTNGQLDLLNRAEAEGFTVTGFRRFEDRRDQTIAAANNRMVQAETNDALAQAAMEMTGGVLNREPKASARGGTGESPTNAQRGTGGPGDPETPGLDRLAAMQPEGGRPSFSQIAANAARRSALSGAFGRGPQMREKRKNAGRLMDKVIDYEIDSSNGTVYAVPVVNEEKIRQYLPDAVRMGGTPESFRGALSRRINSYYTQVEPQNLAGGNRFTEGATRPSNRADEASTAASRSFGEIALELARLKTSRAAAEAEHQRNLSRNPDYQVVPKSGPGATGNPEYSRGSFADRMRKSSDMIRAEAEREKKKKA